MNLTELRPHLTEEEWAERVAIEAARLAIHAAGDGDWETWVLALFPSYCTDEFAPHQQALWEWVWAMQPDARPRPLVEVVFRGGAKSTTAELACVALGARGVRRYGLYVCETQQQADDHVQNVGTMLESRVVGLAYPELGERMVSKYGASRGWRVNRLRTAAGFTLDAVGLDTAARGVKLDEQRPDFVVIDDIDSDADTSRAVDKKIRTLTRGLLPAGSDELAVLAIQNLVHEDSVFARLVDGRADFLADRLVVGPVPAVVDLEWEERDGRYVITGGVPSWSGMPVARCQEVIDDIGLTAWLSEAQHELEPPAGGMFDHVTWERCDPEDVPWGEIVRTVVWCDPAVTSTDSSDSMGIQADGLHADGRIFRLRSWEARTSPVDAIERAIRWAIDIGADHVGIETDQGGDTWRSVYREAVQKVLAERDPDLPADVELDPAAAGEVAVVRRPDGSLAGVPGFRFEKAGMGHGSKAHRASLMLADYERPGRIVHVRGTHLVLERALRRFPKVKPFDLVDGAFWAWRDLRRPVSQIIDAGARAASMRVSTGVR